MTACVDHWLRWSAQAGAWVCQRCGADLGGTPDAPPRRRGTRSGLPQRSTPAQQAAWRELAARWAATDRFAASVAAQPFPITPRQGAALERIER